LVLKKYLLKYTPTFENKLKGRHLVYVFIQRCNKFLPFQTFALACYCATTHNIGHPNRKLGRKRRHMDRQQNAVTGRKNLTAFSYKEQSMKFGSSSNNNNWMNICLRLERARRAGTARSGAFFVRGWDEVERQTLYLTNY